MFDLDSISDDEIDYFDELKTNYHQISLLNFLSENRQTKNNSYKVKSCHKITANIATQPSRFESLLSTLDSIKGQFDEVRIYLNNYSNVPEELQSYTTHIGQDLTDNGKFFWSSNSNEYYFTLDDDIIYPPDYVEKTLPLIGDRVVSYHGRRLTGLDKQYYDNHKVYIYNDELETERKLDVLGTGVMAFDTDYFTPTLWKTENHKMTDLLIALEAHMWNIPIVCLPRKNNWLSHENIFFDGIYFEFKGREDKQIRMANMIQTYISSNIDMSLVNYSYKEESINEIVKTINQKKSNSKSIAIIRCGSGSLVSSIKNSTNFNLYLGFESDIKRVVKLKESLKDIRFSYVSTYSKCEFEPDTFVFLDDYILPKSLSTTIYSNMKENSILLCHNIVNGQFPISKITLKLNSGELTDMYIYQK